MNDQTYRNNRPSSTEDLSNTIGRERIEPEGQDFIAKQSLLKIFIVKNEISGRNRISQLFTASV